MGICGSNSSRAKIDGTARHPARRFALDAFVACRGWRSRCFRPTRCIVAMRRDRSVAVHRRLVALGGKNLVVRPRNLDEYGKR